MFLNKAQIKGINQTLQRQQTIIPQLKVQQRSGAIRKSQSDPEQELRKKKEQIQQKNTESVVRERGGKHQTSQKPGVSVASSLMSHDETRLRSLNYCHWIRKGSSVLQSHSRFQEKRSGPAGAGHQIYQLSTLHAVL